MTKKKVLFVCLGNICRSPAAEGVFLSLVQAEGLSDQIFVDSAGTSGFHAGELADQRMRQHSQKRGIELLSRSRQFVERDFKDFDYILVMDRSNEKNVLAMARGEDQEQKVLMMTSFCSQYDDDEVPDPYYGGADGFEYVLDLVEDAGNGLLGKIKREL